MTKFLYQNIFCYHSCSQKFIMNENLKNKKEIKELLKQYEIRKITVSAYHLQANKMIEQEYMLTI